MFLCVYAILSLEYFVAHRVSEPYFSSSSFFLISFFLFCPRVLALILKLFDLSVVKIIVHRATLGGK